VGAHRGLIRDVALPDEDVRSQTAYVMAHRTPDDVVLVNAAGSYGFAYYLDESPAGFEPAPAVGPGYLPRFPDSTRVIVAAGRSTEAIEESLRRAVASARSRNARVWLVRSHTVASERQALEQAAADLGVTITPVCVTSVSTPSASAECADSEQLAYLDLGRRGA
jgi:hypothetical protein